MTKTTFEIKQDIKVTVDAIVFGYNQGNGISVLLIKRKVEPFKNEWAKKQLIFTNTRWNQG